jgi:hypothetical protein
MLTESHDEEQTIARVAARDTGKAEVACWRAGSRRGERTETTAGGVHPFDDEPGVDRAGQSSG